VAAYGDGWYGFNLPSATLAERLTVLGAQCRKHGRSRDELTLAVALSDPSPALLPWLAAAGVSELVVVAAPPARPDQVSTWVAELAGHWMPTDPQP
jgi:hypothetical protein